MSLARTYRAQTAAFREDYRSSYVRNNHDNINSLDFNANKSGGSRNWNRNGSAYNFNRKGNNYNFRSGGNNFNRSGNHNNFLNQSNSYRPLRKFQEQEYNFNNFKHENNMPSLKRRKFSASSWENCHGNYPQHGTSEAASGTWNKATNYLTRPDSNVCASTSGKRDRSKLEDDDVVFMSREEIERYSPSRKDGIDALRETHLRYSYCAFIQNLGMRLELPQTTIGTAMVLCHRFFSRRSHACHDRFLVATAALFLAAKSEETARPLNDVLRASCEILHKQDLTFLSYLLPIDWFEQYRERVLEAEQMVLTTLDFELNVHHPYAPLTSVLEKLGLSQSVLVNLALNLVSEGIYKISVLACMIILAGGLICCPWKI